MGVITYGSPRPALLVVDSWAGRTRTRVDVIGQCGTRWRIRAISDTKVAGRNHWLRPGQVCRVPCGAIVFLPNE